MKKYSVKALYLLLVLSLALPFVGPTQVAAQPAPLADPATDAPAGGGLTAADFSTASGLHFDGQNSNAPLTASDFPMGEPPASQADLAGQSGDGTDGPLAPVTAASCNRTITADVVALDQPFYYNRLGAIQANGMIYALRRNVVEKTPGGGLVAGNVMLRPDKRPRPIVLRMNEGDCLQITFTNLLDPVQFIFPLPADFPTGQILGLGVPIPQQVADQQLTRQASIHIDGLALVGGIGSDGSNVGQNTPSSLVAPNGSTTYTYYAEHKATHLLYSMGATIGADGGGGARTYGLFGAVNVQPAGSTWYRSQLTREEMDMAASAWVFDPLTSTWSPSPGNVPQGAPGAWNVRTTPGGQPIVNYDAVYPAGTGLGKDNLPVVKILNGPEIVHSDINAIIDDRGYAYPPNKAYPTRGREPYREFTVIFHDDAFGVQAFPAFYNDPVLRHTLAGVTDSFPINYGSGGIGSEIVANRLGVGPMWDCAECKYEEFFLTSFTVGDPAMIVDIPANTTDGLGNVVPGAKATKALFPDDPSNVHHSYLGDRVVFRNLHAGPKEHHVFHLHAHQWQFNPNDPQSNYLDGQAIGPGSGYTYEIAYGGSGNRNLTPGDSIFHCHFYPHFAQGMWEMWRVHDVFEQGTLMELDPVDGLPIPAAGSRALPDGEIAAGTPIPGVVPMPGMAMAPMPDPAATIVASDLNGDLIPDSSQFDANGNGIADIFQAGDLTAAPATNPGYPWFTPGLVGHRPPTPALDILDDGGLPRHVVASGPDEDNPAHAGVPIEMYVSRLDFNKILHEAAAIQIPEGGTAVERVAMNFHGGPGGGDPTYDSYFPDGTPATGTSGFEVNGLPAVRGAPFADPCRTDPDATTGNVANITQNRTIKGANIEMPIVLNKVGWHFQQQRFEALWEDVVPTLTKARAPQPMIMRLNSTDCAEFWHTNLVPNVYQLDDYQVRTPTDIIGQHIHLVKFDVMSADGSANGWNYEDGTLSPDEVRERIEAFNHGGGFKQLNNTVAFTLTAKAHPFFGATGPTGQNWLGARTTIQRWYADPLLERSWDGGVGTVFTHDHYGPSTHQQVGLYSTLLVEPQGSEWWHNETGTQLGTRADGGPTTWQAIIRPGRQGGVQFEPHREFYFEFADFQHAYEKGGGALGAQPNENLLGPSVTIPSYADFNDAINPTFRLPPLNPADIYVHPNWCPGVLGGPVIPRPCPEAISADDPGTYALNFRNEPIGLRVFNGIVGPGAGQTPGLAGDLAFAYQSRTDRAIAALNTQPAGPYPPLTKDVRPGDPWTPLVRVYMGDKVRIRVQVGAHEEEHNFTIPGLKWRQEPNSPNSGWKNSEFFGIDEYFNLDVPIVPDTASGTPAEVDYIYTVGAELEGMWNGVWGILRTYGRKRNDLVEVTPNTVGKNGYAITNQADFKGICPVTAPLKTFDVTAVRAVDVLDPVQGLVYNDRLTTLQALPGGITGQGPLIDPTALMYVRNGDLTYDPVTGAPNGLQPGAPVEPLILRVNAGDCVQVNLTNALPADLGATEMPGWNAMPPIVHKDENVAVAGVGGILTFNANDITPSSQVGLTPQLLAFDPRTDGGFSTGLTTGKLVAPGASGKYTWYAGDVTATKAAQPVAGNRTQFTLSASPVEFGAAGLMPADRIKGTENGFVGALVVEPQDSCWIADPGTRAQATVWKKATDAGGLSLIGACSTVPAASADSFRDFVTVMQNDVNLRYGGTVQVLDAAGAPIETINCGDPAQMRRMECAVPNIAAEGPLGPTEDSQDSGQKAINYGADPLWFRLGIVPDYFQLVHRDDNLKDHIANVFSSFLDIDDGLGQAGDPQTEVYRASPTGPQEGRFRVVMPGGHARGNIYTLHGHEWQRQPYLNRSSEIGDNQDSEYYGTQEGVNPTGHWDFVVDLGGYFDVIGDYLWRDQASFGSFQGLWGLLRFNLTPPMAAADFYSTPENTQLTVLAPGVLANDVDLDGDPFSVSAVNGDPAVVGQPIVLASGATLTLNGDGSFTYTPATGFNGQDSFTYQAGDGGTATVTITVASVNSPPVAVVDAYSAGEDAALTVDPIGVLANDTDPDGDVLTATLVTGVVSGTLTLNPDGSFIYSPNGQFEALGAGEFAQELFTYVASDGLASSNVATVTITITGVNDAPVVSITTPADGSSFTADGVTGRASVFFAGSASDPEQGDLSGSLAWSATDGTNTVNGASPGASATLDLAPGTWTVTASVMDSGTPALPGSASITVIVVPAEANTPPVAVDDVYSTAQNTPLTVVAPGVLGNDTDPQGDAFALNTTPISGPAAGNTLVLNADGSFTYTPGPLFSGVDSFVYKICETATLDLLCGQATVTISVNAFVNTPPVAVDDAYSTTRNTPLTVGLPGVLGNDTDADGNTLTAVAASGATAAGGSYALLADGSFTYTPPFNFTGVDSFTYTASDGTASSNVATVTISVNGTVTVTSATYRVRQNRWQVQGTVSDATNSVDVYLCPAADCNAQQKIGPANVNAIDGSWNLTGAGAVAPVRGDTVRAISSGGGVSAAIPVNVRN